MLPVEVTEPGRAEPDFVTLAEPTAKSEDSKSNSGEVWVGFVPLRLPHIDVGEIVRIRERVIATVFEVSPPCH